MRASLATGVAMMLMFGVGAFAPAAFAKSKVHSLSCSSVSPAMINAALGTSVTAPKVTKNGPVTVCAYPQGNLPQQALVRFQSKTTAKSFKVAESQFTAHGEPVASISGYGSMAYTSSIGTGAYAANTIVALKGSNELLVTAIAPLGSVEQLATQILAKM
jgi:hypothetical protein